MASSEDALAAVVRALHLATAPETSDQDRRAAYEIYEQFRESEPQFQIGFQLANQNNADVVRHFGLQSVEHWIKYRWDSVNDDTKAYLKQASLEYIYQGCKEGRAESRHLKDAASRILVELMKRMWPQLWESLFSDFTKLADKGATQTELVLMVLLRLSEDVVGLASVPGKRSRDLRQALVRIGPSIIEFVLNTLRTNLEQAKSLPSGSAGQQQAAAVSYGGLDTLAGLVEWLPVAALTATNLLPQVANLLLEEDQGLSLRAAECLLLIVGRRGAVDQREPLMVLFSQEAIELILQAATKATADLSQHADTRLVFIKRLAEILLEMAKLLVVMVSEKKEIPENFSTYLQAVLAFLQQPCQSVRAMVVPVWTMFLREPAVAAHPHLQATLPDLTQRLTACLLKVGYPSKNNSPSCDFSRLEYENDEEFNEVMCHLRVKSSEVVGLLAELKPQEAFQAAVSWLQELLEKPVQADTPSGLCESWSPSALAWDGCSVFLDNVMARVMTAGPPPSDRGTRLLAQVIDYSPRDPLILSSALSCLSALFPFLDRQPQALQQIILKLLGVVVFSLPGQTRANRCRAVRDVRTHACSVLVKLCKNHTQLVLPHFEALYQGVQALERQPESQSPSQMERVILTEALIIVCNQFESYERSLAFIGSVMQPVQELWTSGDFVRAFSSPRAFMEYVGLDQPAVEPSSADTCGINRSQIKYCLDVIQAVIKRCKVPEDFKAAERGGYMQAGGGGEAGARNPAFPHVAATLDNMMALLSTACQLWQPHALQARHPDFAQAYQIPERERLNLVGGQSQQSTKGFSRTPLERMQAFTTMLFEFVFGIIGSAAQYLTGELYATPTLTHALQDSLFKWLPHLPDDRLRMMVHFLIKPLVSRCPAEWHETVALPVMRVISQPMLQRLSERWAALGQRPSEPNDFDPNNPEDAASQAQEVLEDFLVRSLSREYLEAWQLCLLSRNKDSAALQLQEEQAMDAPASDAHKDAVDGRTLSPLGNLIVTNAELYPDLMMTLLSGLSWPDTFVCTKCAATLWPVTRKLWEAGSLTAEAAGFTLTSLLQALALHGQHDNVKDALTGAALSLYLGLRPAVPSLLTVLQQIPAPHGPAPLREFDDKFVVGVNAETPAAGAGAKKRKDAFKKIVSHIVGKSVGQKFQKTEQFSSLPKLFLAERRQKQLRVDEESGTDMGLASLFVPSS